MPDIQEIANAVNKLYTDMYVGDGKDNPSVTTRLFDIERTIKDLQTIKWLLVGVICTVIGDIVVNHVK